MRSESLTPSMRSKAGAAELLTELDSLMGDLAHATGKKQESGGSGVPLNDGMAGRFHKEHLSLLWVIWQMPQ